MPARASEVTRSEWALGLQAASVSSPFLPITHALRGGRRVEGGVRGGERAAWLVHRAQGGSQHELAHRLRTPTHSPPPFPTATWPCPPDGAVCACSIQPVLPCRQRQHITLGQGQGGDETRDGAAQVPLPQL